MTRRSLTQFGGTMLVIVAVIWLSADMLDDGARQEARAQSNDDGRAKAVVVQVTPPQHRAVTRTLSMPATLLPMEMADLFAKASGFVDSVAVDIGDKVGKGDALLTLFIPEMQDELRQAEAMLQAKRTRHQAVAAQLIEAQARVETAQAQVQRAQARLELDRVNYGRRVALHQGQAIPQQKLDESKSRLDIAEAELRIAQANVASAEARQQAVQADVQVAQSQVAVAEADLAKIQTLMQYATVRAPFDGMITARLVDPGAFVRSAAEGTTGSLLRIETFDRLRLALEIPESDVAYVKAGTPVKITVKSARGDAIEAIISRTAGSLKASTRTMRAEVDLDNHDGKLSAGMYAQVEIELEVVQQALVIPSKAIRVRGRELSVLVADGSTARSQPVEIGYDDGIWAEVKQGLSGDEQVIATSKGVVVAGAQVEAVALEATDAS
ncbi:MAG: efflux RND transporter periplasmic adaptor subunit [Phycisphaerae bacterium]